MDYPKKKRYYSYIEVLPDGTKRKRKRLRELYEYEPPEKDIRFRAPEPSILDRRREAYE